MKCEHDRHCDLETGDYAEDTPEAEIYLCSACAAPANLWDEMLEAFPGLRPGNDDLDHPLEVNGGDLVQWINDRVCPSP